MSALGRSSPSVTGSEVNHIILEGHGREEIDPSIDISHTLGWFTTIYPVRLEAKSDIGTTIKQTKEMLRTIPNRGIGLETFLTLALTIWQFEGSPSSKTDWSIIDEKSGLSISETNHARNIINGWVIDGELKFTIEAKLDQSRVSKLAEAFKNSLLDIIEHTMSQETAQLTVSDIDFVIGEDYLDRLQSKKELEGIYLANSLQQGFIYHSLSQGHIDDAYIVQLLWHYNAPLDIDLLKQAWEFAQTKFPVLRLRFGWDEELIQIIDTKGQIDWRYFDLS